MKDSIKYWPAERFDEALLDSAPAVVAEEILIVRGEGGRKKLGESERVARAWPMPSVTALPPRQPDAASLARLRHGEIDILVITSIEAHLNLTARA